MKRSEKEHLKDDPLVSFIEDVLVKVKENRKTIINWVVAAAFLIVVVLGTIYFRNSAVEKDNNTYAKAVDIVSSEVMSSGEKITELGKLDSGDGLSSIVPLYISSIYYKEGEYESAEKELAKFEKSAMPLVNEKKLLLEAEVLNAVGKGKDAVKVLKAMLSDDKLITGKDLVLLNLARIQINSELKEDAKVSIDKLLADYPTSQFASDARELKKKVN